MPASVAARWDVQMFLKASAIPCDWD
jgi:hypothetical protein